MKIRSFILKIIFGIMLCSLTGFLYSQNYAISGYITDINTKETLIGATIFLPEKGLGVISDRYGYFQLAGLSKGKHLVRFSYVGYETQEIEIEIKDRGITLSDVKMIPHPVNIDEAIIVASGPGKAADKQIETSMIEISPKMIQSIPTARNDVFSAIKFLPGIDRTEPFSPLFTVRGGEPGENAVLLDGVMIYNPYHSAINSGIFNTQTIKSVDMLVGGFGAEFGGRNSSVMYISTKDGNSSELHGEIEPSTFHSKAFFEFPVGEKGSAVVAGRYFFDIFSYFVMQTKGYFYDYNFSYTYRLNPRHRFTAKYFQSHDRNVIDMNTFYKYIDNTLGWNLYEDFSFIMTDKWTNRAATLIHNWILSPAVFIRSQLYYSSHSSEINSEFDYRLPDVIDGDSIYTNIQLKTSSAFNNRIADISAKTRINLTLARFNTFTAGMEYNDYSFRNNAKINMTDQGSLAHRPLQWAVFAEDKLEAGPLIIRPGIRTVLYNDKKWLPEPRLNLVLALPGAFKVRSAAGIYHQYVISMNTNEIEMNQNVDYYFPLSGYSPGKSIHYIAGIDKQLNPSSILSFDLYYKDIQRVYTFDINQTDETIVTLSNKLQQGSGNAYGAEILLKGAKNNLSGWCSYVLSWANRKYPFIYNGREYPYDYNRRHTLKILANYALTKSLEYNTTFTYLSGVYRSIEQLRQDYYYYDPVSGELSMFPIWISNEKNNAKMPAIINLDMSIKKRLRCGFGRQFSDLINAEESYMMVTIRNLTFFRRNVEYYFPAIIKPGDTRYLPLGTNYLPSVGFSYSIKF